MLANLPKIARGARLASPPLYRHVQARPNCARSLQSTRISREFHFDTHHFVQRLEREGLNRAQAEGLMAAIAEVIDESIRNMTSNMVTKSDQEKVRALTSLKIVPFSSALPPASIYPESGLRTTEVRVAVNGEERPRDDESRERSCHLRPRETKTTASGGDCANAGGS